MSREKAREALRKLEELEAKRREQERFYHELRNRLEDEAYGPPRRRPYAVARGEPTTCSVCGAPFVYREEVIEILDDDGNILRRQHFFNCRDALHRKNQGWVG